MDEETLLPVHARPRPKCCSFLFSSVKALLIANNNLFIISSGPVACAIICLCVKDVGGPKPEESRNMLAVLTWVFLWWLTEAVPVAVASMAPLFLFPIFGIASADEVAKSYMDDIISLVLGSFILALAVEHYNIHRRLALNITLLFSGEPLNPGLLLLGVCGTTAFVSMWMHNTAAAVMMMPVATGILQRLPASAGEGGSTGHRDVTRFAKALVLGVTYSAAIGGMSTLTGTGVNLILVGIWRSYFPDAKPITFSTWSLFAFPLALLIFIALYSILCLLYCSKTTTHSLAAYLDREHLKRELHLLGPMAFAEKMVLAIFSMLVVLWMTRNLTDQVSGWGALFHGRMGDGTVSVIMATLLFIIPNRKGGQEKLMDWNKCKKLPWNIVLLLGAGFAIADGVRTSGLAHVLSASLRFLESTPYMALSPAICLIGSIITEFTSNNATTTLLIPLLIQLAQSMHSISSPLLLMVPGAIGAQFAFLLPTGTPSNVVGFTTGHLSIKDLIATGLPLKVAGIAVLSLLMPTLGTFVFGTYQTSQQGKSVT